MAHTVTAHAQWTAEEHNQTNEVSLYTKWLRFTDSQAQHKTMWFMVSLMAQGVLFLPVPAVLLYYFNAPIIVLAVTLTLFFANIIAGMGGLGIRAIISLFAISTAIHLLMLAIFIL